MCVCVAGVAGIPFHYHSLGHRCDKDVIDSRYGWMIEEEEEEEELNNTAPGTHWVGHRRPM